MTYDPRREIDHISGVYYWGCTIPFVYGLIALILFIIHLISKGG